MGGGIIHEWGAGRPVAAVPFGAAKAGLVREGRERRERRAKQSLKKDPGDSAFVAELEIDSRRTVWRASLTFVGTG
jgi:hypothetical protein